MRGAFLTQSSFPIGKKWELSYGTQARRFNYTILSAVEDPVLQMVSHYQNKRIKLFGSAFNSPSNGYLPLN